MVYRLHRLRGDSEIACSYVADYEIKLITYLESICGLRAKEIQTTQGRIELFIGFIVRECIQACTDYDSRSVHRLILMHDVEVFIT